MKKFYELTKPQQEQAVRFARLKLNDLIINGILVTDRQMTKDQAHEIAVCAAEDAWYSERDDQVIADIADGK